VTALLARAAAVAELHGRLGAHRKALRDLPELKSNFAIAERETQRLVKELRAEGPHSERGPAPLTRAQQRLLQELAGREQTVLSRADAAALATKRAEAELKVARENLAALGNGPDGSALRRAAATVQKEGDLEREVSRAESAHAAAETAAAKQLRKLQPGVETLTECEALALPSPETAARFEKEWEESAQSRRALMERLRETREGIARSRRTLDELLLGGAIPSEAELAEARAERDRLWRILRDRWPQAGAADFETYAESVAKADALADALRRDADRVARKAHLELQLSQDETQGEALAAELEAHERAFAKLQSEWQAAWAPLNPLPPREMTAWRREHARLLEQIESVRDHVARHEELRARVRAHRETLSAQLAAHGVNGSSGNESLAALLDHATNQAEQLDHTARQRATLAGEIGKLAVRLETARAEQEQAEAGIAKWREEWRAALRSVSWPETAVPTEATALIACSTELQARAAEAESLRARIESIETEAAAFTAETAALCAELAPELASHPAEEAVLQLHARVTTVQARRAKLDDLEERLQAEAASAELNDFLHELEALDPDALAAQIAENEAEIERREAERAIHEQRVGQETVVVTTMDGNARAIEVADRAQTVLAQIEEQSERYIRLRLGAAILRREIERYRAENQDPLLRRAGEFFNKLTLGSFASITTDFDANDNPVLKGVRAAGEEVGVEGMSEGTRDQLFLALQLASVEKFIATAEPMPFVVDDVLVAFDQEREAAVLSVLAELSRKTQVIIFTHHAHLVELAERNLGGDVLRVHRLGGRG
jgi:DNA repair exonuclease SbcCD ATPase subunit